MIHCFRHIARLKLLDVTYMQASDSLFLLAKGTSGFVSWNHANKLLVLASYLQSKSNNMPLGKNFTIRIEILDELLAARKWTKVDLFERLNEKLEEFDLQVSDKTFHNDLNYLINQKGAPLHRPKKSDPYYYYTEQFSIMNLPLNEEEVSYLRKAIDILKQVSNFQMIADVESIIQKLENRVNTIVEENAPEIIQFEKQPLLKGAEYIDDLFEAIKHRKAVRIDYQPFTYDSPAEITVFPYLLKEYRNRWFLFGRKMNALKLSTFALDRIVQIKNSKEDFENTKNFDPGTYFKHLVGVSLPYDAVPEKIQIKVYKDSAPYIKSKKLHETQQTIKEYVDGSILIEIEVVINYELTALLLSYGPGLEVKKPLSYKEKLIKSLQHALKHYE